MIVLVLPFHLLWKCNRKQIILAVSHPPALRLQTHLPLCVSLLQFLVCPFVVPKDQHKKHLKMW